MISVPFDTATSFRSGTRFGPQAIGPASALLRPRHPPLDVDVLGTLSIVDGGDVGMTLGNALRTTEQIAAALEPVVAAGIVPVVLDGDHSIVLAELRAHAAVPGPVALVVVPELANSGYVFRDAEEARALSEPAHGPTVSAWVELAREHDLVVVGGFCEEKPEGRLHDSAVLIDGSRGVRAVYRAGRPTARHIRTPSARRPVPCGRPHASSRSQP